MLLSAFEWNCVTSSIMHLIWFYSEGSLRFSLSFDLSLAHTQLHRHTRTRMYVPPRPPSWVLNSLLNIYAPRHRRLATRFHLLSIVSQHHTTAALIREESVVYWLPPSYPNHTQVFKRIVIVYVSSILFNRILISITSLLQVRDAPHNSFHS